MKYPRLCNWITFIPLGENQWEVADTVRGCSYTTDETTVHILQEFDGKTDPIAITKKYPREAVWNVLKVGRNLGILQDGRIWRTGDGGRMLTIVETGSFANRTLAKWLNTGLIILWLPLLLLGVYIFMRNYRIEQCLEFNLESILGLATGVILGCGCHELAHSVCSIAMGGKCYEVGLSLQHGVSFYALIDERMIRSPLRCSLVDISGILANFLLAGVSLAICSAMRTYSPFLFAVAGSNLLLGLINCVMTPHTDGCHAIQTLLGEDNPGLLRMVSHGILVLYKVFLPSSYAWVFFEIIEIFKRIYL